jgi:hypothetical protein
MVAQKWRAAELGRDLGRYSFRQWKIPFTPLARSVRIEVPRDQSRR